MTGLEAVAQAIAEDMERRLPKQRKTQRQKLAILTAALLSERTVNLMDLGHALPIPSPNPGTRYQWIKRTLANDRIVPAEVMAPYARQILENLSTNGRQPILMIDQSQATKLHRHEMLMVAVRVGGRALPLAWWMAFPAGYGLSGVWWGLALGLFLVATGLLLWIRLRGPAVLARPQEAHVT